MASSPADRQVAANRTREGLAELLHGVEKRMLEETRERRPGGYVRPSWVMLTEERREFFREYARRLLVHERLRIEVKTDAPPIEGQQSMLDEPMFPLPDLDPELREGIDR